jgi:hypothetical protein
LVTVEQVEMALQMVGLQRQILDLVAVELVLHQMVVQAALD